MHDQFFRTGWRWWLFNASFFRWESDVLAFNDKGQIMEVCVITDPSALTVDLGKHKHSDFRCRFMTERRLPTKFYYACPWEAIREDQVPDYAGLIYFLDNGRHRIVKGAFTLSYETTNEEDLYVIIEKSNAKMLELWRSLGQL